MLTKDVYVCRESLFLTVPLMGVLHHEKHVRACIKPRNWSSPLDFHTGWEISCKLWLINSKLALNVTTGNVFGHIRKAIQYRPFLFQRGTIGFCFGAFVLTGSISCPHLSEMLHKVLMIMTAVSIVLLFHHVREQHCPHTTEFVYESPWNVAHLTFWTSESCLFEHLVASSASRT